MNGYAILDCDHRPDTQRSGVAKLPAELRHMFEVHAVDSSHPPALRRDWESIDDLVAVALERLRERLVDHPVELKLPEDLPPMFVDATLVVQLLAHPHLTGFPRVS